MLRVFYRQEPSIVKEQTVVTLSVDQWLLMIGHIKASSDADKYMYILRLWANAQEVKNTSYQAFDGLLGESARDFTAVTLRIEQITRWVEVVVDGSGLSLSVCQLDESLGKWVVSSEQCVNLRQAIGFSNMPTDS